LGSESKEETRLELRSIYAKTNAPKGEPSKNGPTEKVHYAELGGKHRACSRGEEPVEPTIEKRGTGSSEVQSTTSSSKRVRAMDVTGTSSNQPDGGVAAPGRDQPGINIDRAAQISASGVEYLQSFNDRCIMCGTGHHVNSYGAKDGPEPNHCPRLRGMVSAEVCRLCLQPGHRYNEICALVKDGKRTDPKVLKCAVICIEHFGYKNLKPCTFCWLVHPREGDGRCLVSKHLVRSCFLAIWLRADWRKKFWEMHNRTNPSAELGSCRDFRAFVEWGVFGESDHLHNVFRVVSFVRERLAL
jgi:hypothetical protein